MKFSTLVTLATLAIPCFTWPVQRRSDAFGFVAIHSGSPLQYATLILKDGKAYLGSGDGPSFEIDSGKLKVVGSDEYVYVDKSSRAVLYGSDIPSDDISVTWNIDNYLELNENAGSIACQVGSSYQLYWIDENDNSFSCSNSYGVGLMPVSIASPTTSSSTAATTKVHAAEATVTLLPPNLLIPAKKTEPTKAFGSQYTGKVVTDEIETFVSFDVPPLSSKQVGSCHLKWSTPSIGSFPSTIKGTKEVDVYVVNETLNESTLTWDNKPTRGSFVGTFNAASGVFTKSSVTCDFGKKQQFELVAHGNSDVEWFQELKPLTGFNYIMLA
ncbi:ubiquitin 3 binding protein But2 C-terminal domain-containing protein [Dipodascopsis uninucleata]